MPEAIISRVLNHRWFAIALALVIFLPLLFINIRSDHDWGDDFAQYLAQAENISKGIPMAQTGYIYNDAYPSLGPKAYPPGFPLMIAPLVSRYGNEVLPYNILISCLLIITAVLSVLFLKRLAGFVPALALSLVIFYNPYVIGLKSEIMADVPFALLLLLFLFFTVSKNNLKLASWIAAGVAAGLATAFKTAGFALLIALLALILQKAVFALWNRQTRLDFYRQALHPAYALCAGLLVYLIFYVGFMRGSGGESSYLNTFSLKGLMDTMAMNIFTYSEVLRKFFIETSSLVYWFGFIAGAAAVTFFITGLLLSLIRKPGLMEWVTLIYVGLLLVYPYHNSGFRFLLPLAPVIMWYIVVAVMAYQPGRAGKYFSSGFALLMLVVYFPELIRIQQSIDTIQEGPYTSVVMQAFEKTENLTPAEVSVAFIKPRALARYSHRHAFSGQPESTPTEIYRQMQILKPDYYLLYSELPDPALENYIKTNRNQIEMVWRSPYFQLFRNRIVR
ncbi:MAG: hypothetical protein RBR28_03100 [Lentimicrobium sp.]|jgi:hypothetical protein|nr:hypothetical protein [Lentimicrobium sp.]